jgi:hypothetical protein
MDASHSTDRFRYALYRPALIVLNQRECLFGTDPYRFHYPFTRRFGRMFVQQVQLVVITDFENIGSNLHAARIALAAVIIDYDLRTRISPQDLPSIVS